MTKKKKRSGTPDEYPDSLYYPILGCGNCDWHIHIEREQHLITSFEVWMTHWRQEHK